MIIFRYLSKEIALTWLTTTVVLMMIFMSTQFIHYLTQASLGSYAATILFKIMLLQIPYLLGLLIPVGFFSAILLAYGRLHADREMMVLASSGFSHRQLVSMTLLMAVGVAIITALFTLWLSPIVASKQKHIIEEAKAAPIIESLLPGRFFASPDGSAMLYVESISRDHQQLQRLFLSLPSSAQNPNEWTIVTAASGEEVEQNGQKFLIIHQGYRYRGIPGQANYEVIGFKDYGIALQSKPPIIHENAQMLPTLGLSHSSLSKREITAEFQWRIASPLSVFILALLAIPLSAVNPRQGKFAKLVPAMLIYILYANMMFVARDWIEAGSLPGWLGLWWLHLMVFILAFYLNLKQAHFRLRFKGRAG